MSGRAVPRAEGVTFESGLGGMRMEKDRGAAAVVQPLYIRAGRLSDPPFGGHSPGNSRTRKPVCGHGFHDGRFHQEPDLKFRDCCREMSQVIS